jgi:hypothetical protein
MATTAIDEIVSRELNTGLRQLVGTRISAAIEVSEAVIQSALLEMPDVPPTLKLQLAPANEIVVSYGVVRVTAVLADALDLSGPRLVVELRSTIIAWGLQQMIKTPGISVSGRRVMIDLARMDALANLRSLWPHFRAIRLKTVAGALFVQVDFAVQ